MNEVVEAEGGGAPPQRLDTTAAHCVSHWRYVGTTTSTDPSDIPNLSESLSQHPSMPPPPHTHTRSLSLC